MRPADAAKRQRKWALSCLVLTTVLVAAPRAQSAQETAGKPRLLVLPWVVIDRTTNRDCTKPAVGGGARAALAARPIDPTASIQTPSRAEARRLAQDAQEALDAVMHRHGKMEMIPRTEWQPLLPRYRPGRLVRQGDGCAVCIPVGALLEYDRAALQELAHELGAEYVWLGVTVVPLTRDGPQNRPDDCCREALEQERAAVLVRSSALLVRVADGAIVWQRDARRLERSVPRRVGRTVRTEAQRREYGVRHTARVLGDAFIREHRRGGARRFPYRLPATGYRLSNEGG